MEQEARSTSSTRPGFNIFINDTKAALVAADAALVLVDGVAGVEVQTEKVWSFADEFKLPRAIVINKLDRERSEFRARAGERADESSAAPPCPDPAAHRRGDATSKASST